MRTTDSNLAVQAIMGRMTGGTKYQVPQHVGVYVAYVTDTHTNNSQVAAGTVKFRIPHLGNEIGWPAASFPGTNDPPIGTECIVGFEGMLGDQPRILSFNDWRTGSTIFYTAIDPVTTAPSLQVGDLWIDSST